MLRRTLTFRAFSFIMLGLIVICSGGGLIVLSLVKGASSRRLQQKLEQLSEKGIPVDDASLEQLHQKLSSPGNAQIWAQALDEFGSEAFSNRSIGIPIVGNGASVDIPKPGVQWSDQAAVEQFLADYSETLQPLIEVAQDNAAVLYPIQFKARSFPLPSREGIIKAARVLQLEAIVAYRQGDTEREFRAINAMVGCALSIRGEPMLYSQLFSNGVHRMALWRMQAAIEGNRLTVEQLGTLRTRLSAFMDIKQPFVVGVMGDLSIGTRALRDQVLVNPSLGKLNGVIYQLGITDRAAIRLAERLEAGLELPTEDLQSFLTMCKMLDSTYSNTGGIEQLEESLNQGYFVSLGSIAEALIQCKMLNDLAILAIAIRQFEYSNGRLPVSLDELEAEGIQLDAFQCLDGNLPGYLVRGSEIGARTQSSSVLWSYDPRSIGNDWVTTVPSAPPNRFPNKKIDPNEVDPWQWDFSN